MKILVFEGRNEIIVGDPERVEALVIEWFRDTGRSLEDYETYTVDGTEGFAFSTQISCGAGYEYVEVREMIPARLPKGQYNSAFQQGLEAAQNGWERDCPADGTRWGEAWLDGFDSLELETGDAYLKGIIEKT